MTDPEYNALLEREHELWGKYLAADATRKLAEAVWEAACDQLTEENLRRATAQRLCDAMPAQRRSEA